MSKILVEDCGSFATLRLNNKTSNAIDTELVSELSVAIKQVRREFQGLLLAGGDKFFCIGFDLPSLLPLKRTEMADFLTDYDQVIFDIFSVPLPTVCAMRGHAIGGGNVLALTCDFRFAAMGKKFMGLNEVKLGLPVPYLADLILRQLINDRPASSILYHGELLLTDNAHKIGMVDEILPPKAVEDRAIEKILDMLSRPLWGFGAMKDNRTESIVVKYRLNQEIKRKIFLDGWFNESNREVILEAAKKF
jgi:enoyl-CoA hydratase/carnithine racemase